MITDLQRSSRLRVNNEQLRHRQQIVDIDHPTHWPTQLGPDDTAIRDLREKRAI